MKTESRSFQVFLQDGTHVCLLIASNLGGILTPLAFGTDHFNIEHRFNLVRIILSGKKLGAKPPDLLGREGGEDQSALIVIQFFKILRKQDYRCGTRCIVVGAIKNAVTVLRGTRNAEVIVVTGKNNI